MKKTICLILVTVILLSLGVQAYAATKVDGIITPMWTKLATISANLSIDSLGVATCAGTMSLNSLTGNYKSTLIIELQQQNSGKWSTIYAWPKTGSSVVVNETYRAVSKGTYRIVVTGEVYDSNGKLIETGSINSSTKTYK